MNKVQKLIVSLFCFLVGVFLIYGAYLEEVFDQFTLPWHPSAGLRADIKLYLGIIFIGAGFFFLFKEVKKRIK